MAEILKSIEGNLIGLDKDDNLLVKGSKVIVHHMGQEIDAAADSFPATGITYDESDRVATYVKNGVTYTCAYYTEGNGDGKLATITGGGITRTYTYNADGLLTDEVIT